MSEQPDLSGKQAFAERLSVMRSEYVRNLPGKLSSMQYAWDAIQHKTASSETIDSLYWAAHNLSGSGGTFGFPDITATSRSLLAALMDFKHAGYRLDVESAAQIGKALNALGIAIRREVVNGNLQAVTLIDDSGNERGHEMRRQVYLVDSDSEFAYRIAEKLQNYGYAVRIFEGTAEFEVMVASGRPDAILMEMSLPSGAFAGADCILRHKESLDGIPVIFLSRRDDLESRLHAARAGSYHYFVKPVDMPLLHQKLDWVTKFWGKPEYKVLLVDDDEYLTGVYKSIFEAAGITVSLLNDPALVIGKMQQDMPDLILLDVNMPGINGLELGSVIRQFEAFMHIPIVFLTADVNMDKRLAAMHLGGDDFLGKGVAPAFLIEVVRTRIEKSRNLKSGEQQIKKLIHEYENLRKAQDNHSMICTIDPAGNMTDVNDRMCSSTGYTRAELLNKSFRMLGSEVNPASFYDRMWDILCQGKVWQGQIQKRTKSGQPLWLDVTTTPIQDGFGTIEKFISIRTDITKLKALELGLREERERLTLAMEATNTGLWEWNIAENATYYSERCRKLLNMSPEVDISWPELIHPDDFDVAVEQLVRHIIGEVGMYTSEHRKINADGGWDWVLESGKVVETDEQGEIVRMIGTMQIINARKALEAIQEQLSRQLLQSSKMEAIGQLTSGVAHDFNNILGGMLGYVELSTGLLGRDNPNLDKLQRYLGEIQSAGTRAKELVEQMLVFSRLLPEAEEQAQPVTRVLPVVKEVINLLISTIPATIKLSFHLPEEDLRTAIQPVHLHQILLNLGINARDAIGKYGEIDIKVGKSEISGLECASCHQRFTGKFIELIVKDNGSGIPPEILNKIFDPFFTTKSADKGTGMGLAVVSSVVHPLGGHIRVETEPGRGSMFRIYLLEAEGGLGESLQGSGESEMEVPGLTGVRILLVDDEHTMAAMLKELLSINGAEVSAFTDSGAALREYLLRPDEFDLVITDETMPELTGLDLAKQIHSRTPGLPIILCTGYSERITPEAVENAGIAFTMTKPLKVSLLLAKIHELMSRSHAGMGDYLNRPGGGSESTTG